METEENLEKLKFELVALAEIYFKEVLEKLSEENKIELMQHVLVKYDQGNPLIERFSELSFIDISEHFASSVLVDNTGPCVMAIENFNGNKLGVVKVIKDFFGAGLYDTKSAIDLSPRVSFIGLSHQRVLELERDLIKVVPKIKVKTIYGNKKDF